MSNERTDEFLSWRVRLDQPEALPEQGLDDHEASWQRLAERLREKPRRRMTGYWVGAACLLLALIPVVRLLHPRPPAIALRPTTPVARHTSVRQQALAEKVADKPLPVVNPVTAPTVVNRHRSPVPVVIPRPAAPPAITAAAITVPGIKPATDSHQLMDIPRTELPLLVSAAPSRVLSPKKQLKVVYYNEIGNPSGPSPSTAARIPSFLKFSMGRSGSPVAGDPVEPDKDPVLTIKLIPQNH
jgi:hypothetical protein